MRLLSIDLSCESPNHGEPERQPNLGCQVQKVPGVLSLPSPWLLLIGMLNAGKHIDLRVHHKH